jgi:hypothetical protein
LKRVSALVAATACQARRIWGVGGVLLPELDPDADGGQAMLLFMGTIRNGIIAGLASAEDAPHLYCQDKDARARRRR